MIGKYWNVLCYRVGIGTLVTYLLVLLLGVVFVVYSTIEIVPQLKADYRDSVIILMVIILVTFINSLMKIVSFVMRFREMIKILPKMNDLNPISFKNDDFARETIKYRFNDILKKIKETENIEGLDYDSFCSAQFEADNLVQRLPYYLSNESALNTWAHSLGAYKTNVDFIRDAPFIDVEHYFYFYIIDKANSKSISDPYISTKENDLQQDMQQDMQDRKSKIFSALLNLDDTRGNKKESAILTKLIEQNLSSNSSDLSQMSWKRFFTVNNIDNDSIKRFWDYINTTTELETINILVDNGGVEFLCDLLLAYKLSEKTNCKVVFYVKQLPIFVSDVVEADYDKMMKIIEDGINTSSRTDDEKERMRKNLRYIQNQFERKVFEIRPTFECNMPTEFCDSDELSKLFKEQNSLLIIKGDLNFRRLVGDYKYIEDVKIKSVIRKEVKVPLLIIRSFKSNVILDVPKNNVAKFNEKDAEWRTNGRYGFVKFILPKKYKKKI